MTITREQFADLRPGDVVEYRRSDWPAEAVVRGPLEKSEYDETLYILGGHFGVRDDNGTPYEPCAITVISRAPQTAHDCPDCQHFIPRVGEEWTSAADWYQRADAMCGAETQDAPAWVCCRRGGHPMPHIAGDGRYVLAVWS